MFVSVALFVALMLSVELHADFVFLFTPLEYRYSGGGYHDTVFRYRLFVPDVSEQEGKRPLIVWLHGYGEAGHDNIAHLRWLDRLILRPPWERRSYQFFVLAVQCPHENGHWYRSSASATDDDMVNVAAAIVEQTVRDNPIDPRRVYLAGVSSGGNGCWELALRHPERFAAVAPLASEGISQSQIDRLIGMPIWVFNSNQDATTPIGHVREVVSDLKKAGGNVHLTEVDSTKHDCWTAAFEDYDLLEWLLSQRRGESSRWNAPGTIFLRGRVNNLLKGWAISQIVLQVGVLLALLTVVWYCAKQVRRRHSGAKSELQTGLDPMTAERHGGFTLVEVLIVIAIIGVLVAITLPAVQMAREASRRSTCANNLRQQAVAVRLHEETHKTFPTGGWKDYLGDPDAGYGPKQSGGWIYNILPYIEEDNLRQLGRGLKGQPREQALTTLMQSPIEVFYCPSRRLPRLYPYTGPELKNAKPPKEVAKTDYAISATISYEKSEVIMSDIQTAGKGVSKTILAGEKSLSADAYDTGSGAGDTVVAYVGDSDDIRRPPTGSPVSDNSGGIAFGGPHSGGTNIAYCDGSVRFLGEDQEIEPSK